MRFHQGRFQRMQRLGELALEHGGILALVGAAIGGAIAAIVTPFSVHHHLTSTYATSSICPRGVCVGHLDTTGFNEAWLNAVVLGGIVGAIAGFLLAWALRSFG